MLLVFIITPYRIAFTTSDQVWWVVTDAVIDFMFFVDILVTFYSAYYTSEYILIDKRATIFCHYITGWFIIDVVSILPFNYIGSGDLNSIAKLTRVQRLYRLVKVLRFLRMFKGVKK